MNTEDLKRILQKAKEGSTSLDLNRMIDAFEEFAELYEQRNLVCDNPKEYLQKLNESYQVMWDSFDKAATSYGLNRQIIRQFFADPTSFTTEDWRGTEIIKQNVSNAAPKNTKFNKNKKRVKV
jgi:hypothetical protein